MSGANDNEDAGERILSLADVALFEAVHALCGAGVGHGREWWELEAARLGSDWPGVIALRTKIIGELTAKAMKHAAWWAMQRKGERAA
jgi:hypothetical protein